MTNKILVIGNSSSGKSTLAKHLAKTKNLTHLDLDTIAWQPNTSEPKRAEIHDVKTKLASFTSIHDNWVIEGCYGDIIELVLGHASELYFMNLPLDECAQNARSRPWEPHKYKSKQEQDDNLSMLIDWIKAYKTRNDDFSYAAHFSLYNKFTGVKHCLTQNVLF